MQTDGAQCAAAPKGYPRRDGRVVDEPRRKGGGRERLRVQFQLSAAIPTAALQPKPRPDRGRGSFLKAGWPLGKGNGPSGLHLTPAPGAGSIAGGKSVQRVRWMRSRCAGAFPHLRLEGELRLTRELRVVPRIAGESGS